MIESPSYRHRGGPWRVLAYWLGLIGLVGLGSIVLEAAGSEFSGASWIGQVVIVLLLLGAVALGIAMRLEPPVRASAGLVAGKIFPRRISAALIPAVASSLLTWLWLEPGPRPVEPGVESSITLIVRGENLHRSVVPGPQSVHLQVQALSQGTHVPIVVDPPWVEIASTLAGASTAASITFATESPTDSPTTVWVQVDETSWPIRVPPDRLEVAGSTDPAQVARLKALHDPASGGIRVEQDVRGLALGRLVPAVRLAAPWPENAPIADFTSAGIRALIPGQGPWYRSSPRHHYVASYAWAREQKSAGPASWSTSDPPLAYPLIGCQVPSGFFTPTLPNVQVFYPLVSVAILDGLPEPYLVAVDSQAASTSMAGPDVLPDSGAPSQGRSLLEDLIRSDRSRVHSAPSGFVVVDQPATLWLSRTFNLPTRRRLPASPSIETKQRGQPIRIVLLVMASGLLIASLWGRTSSVGR